MKLTNLNNKTLKKLEAIKKIDPEVYNKILNIDFKYRDFGFNVNPTLQLHEINKQQILELEKNNNTNLTTLWLALLELLEEIKFFRMDGFNNISFVNIQNVTV